MILIFQKCLVHYRVDIFKILHKRLGCIICFGEKEPPGSCHLIVPADFAHYQMKQWYLFPQKNEMVIQQVITPLFKFKPKIVIVDAGLSILSNWVILGLKYFLGYKLILWGHGFNRKIGFRPEVHLSDKLRLWWMNRADAVITYSQSIKQMFSKYVQNRDKIFVAGNTLNTDHLINIRNKLDRIGKENIKEKLGLIEKYNIVYIGRILREKEPDRLIEVFRIVSQEIKSVGLQIVGDGPFLEELKSLAKNLKVTFWGGLTDDVSIGRILFVSDLMVMPGYLGLSVVHSFCFDTPIVSQKQGNKGPFHSPEVDYVIDGRTGFLVEYDDNYTMAERIVEFLRNEQQQKLMKDGIRYMVENVCNIENMIKGFKQAVSYLSSRK